MSTSHRLSHFQSCLDMDEHLEGNSRTIPTVAPGQALASSRFGGNIDLTQTPNSGYESSQGVIPSHSESLPLPNHVHSSLRLNRTPVKGGTAPSRYYATVFLSSDHFSCAASDDSGDHRSWTTQDVLTYHESRKALLPTAMMTKLDKINTVAAIEHDIQRSKGALDEKKKARHSVHAICSAAHSSADLIRTSVLRPISKSMYEPVPAQRLDHESSQPPLLTPKFSFESSSNENPDSGPSRRTSSDAFLSPSSPHADRLQAVGGPDSLRSSMVSERRSHRYDPEATFDGFLVPHKSGKGEVYRGSENAKKENGRANESDSPTYNNKENKLTRHIFGILKQKKEKKENNNASVGDESGSQ